MGCLCIQQHIIDVRRFTPIVAGEALLLGIAYSLDLLWFSFSLRTYAFSQRTLFSLIFQDYLAIFHV